MATGALYRPLYRPPVRTLTGAAVVTTDPTMTLDLDFTTLSSLPGSIAYTGPGVSLTSNGLSISTGETALMADISWFNASAGTIIAEFNMPTVPGSGTQTVISIDDGTANERFTLRVSSGTLAAPVVDGGVVQASVTPGGGTVTSGTTYRLALAYSLNDFAGSRNGSAVTTDAAGTLPTVTRMTIGYRLTTEHLGGYIRKLRYYNVRKSNADLITLSTV